MGQLRSNSHIGAVASFKPKNHDPRTLAMMRREKMHTYSQQSGMQNMTGSYVRLDKGNTSHQQPISQRKQDLVQRQYLSQSPPKGMISPYK